MSKFSVWWNCVREWKSERESERERKKEMAKRAHSSTCTGHIFSGNSRNTSRWLQYVKPVESRWIRALQKEEKQFPSQYATFSLAHALLLTFFSVRATDRMISALFFLSFSLSHSFLSEAPLLWLYFYLLCFFCYNHFFSGRLNNRAVCLQIKWRRRACC